MTVVQFLASNILTIPFLNFSMLKKKLCRKLGAFYFLPGNPVYCTILYHSIISQYLLIINAKFILFHLCRLSKIFGTLLVMVKIHGGHYSWWEILKCSHCLCSPFLAVMVVKSFSGCFAVLVCTSASLFQNTLYHKSSLQMPMVSEISFL